MVQDEFYTIRTDHKTLRPSWVSMPHVLGEATRRRREDAMPSRPIVLLVTAPEGCQQLLADLESFDDVQVLTAYDCRQARRTLGSNAGVALVLTSLSHRDGNWCDLLRFVVNRGIETHVVVSTPQADGGLWSEVLWRGGYDVLVQPYERAELRRIVQEALRAKPFPQLARSAVA